MKEWGLNDRMQALLEDFDLEGFELARVIAEHKERYDVQTASSTFGAEITGNIRFTARGREDFPAVGDWVKIMMMDEDTAIIQEVLPRYSMLKRRSVSSSAEVQVIATNIDQAFIVQSTGHDFNLNRLERYLTVCNEAGITPIIVLSKTDLVEESELQSLLGEINDRGHDVPLIALSNVSGAGIEQLESLMEPAQTYCFLGSSGVGKSTIINRIYGSELLKTSEISETTAKGRHTTSLRELVALPNGSLVIDTAGMREIGMSDDASGIETTFNEIVELGERCRFSDCSHENEAGCAVLEAMESGEVDEDVYQNYMKLRREQEHFSSTVAERRKKDKDFGKMVKAVMDDKKRFKDR